MNSLTWKNLLTHVPLSEIKGEKKTMFVHAKIYDYWPIYIKQQHFLSIPIAGLQLQCELTIDIIHAVRKYNTIRRGLKIITFDQKAELPVQGTIYLKLLPKLKEIAWSNKY